MGGHCDCRWVRGLEEEEGGAFAAFTNEYATSQDVKPADLDAVEELQTEQRLKATAAGRATRIKVTLTLIPCLTQNTNPNPVHFNRPSS